MSKQTDQNKGNTGPQKSAVRRILIVDDSRAQRRILLAYLNRWGFDVLEADSGDAALELCRNNDIDLVLSDWMMPGMNGLDFCAAFRAMTASRYGYFILLTSKSEKGEVAHGLDMGADDFLTKPVSALELRARISAGDRILKMERELIRKNELINETLSEISELYHALDSDLAEARNLQISLVRETSKRFGGTDVSLMLHPSGHVGGDLVGFFEISETEFGIFSIDVSGHGVASAMMTARIAAYLSGRSPEQNLALRQLGDGSIIPRSPVDAARELDRLFKEEMKTELYFTMMLGHFDTTTGRGEFVQCGHPHAAIQRANGNIEFAGTGGLPVGLVPDADWESFSVQLRPGDRIIFVSDGITECSNRNGKLLEETGLADLLRSNAGFHREEFFEKMLADLNRFHGRDSFPDDISAVLLEFDMD